MQQTNGQTAQTHQPQWNCRALSPRGAAGHAAWLEGARLQRPGKYMVLRNVGSANTGELNGRRDAAR
jgi:hypothetical protein